MRPRGLTLLELLVVLGIAALAVAVVGFRADAWIERSAYHQAVRDVATLLRAGKTLAVQQGREVGVHLDTAGRVLSLGDDSRHRVVLPPHLDVRIDQPMPGSAVSASHVAGRPLFVFRADGTAYGGHLLLLRGGAGVAFQINWALGTVEQTDVAEPSS